jgi:hypothetical protein
VATAAQERDEILHRLRSLVMVLGHNIAPLRPHVKSAAGIDILDDLDKAAQEVTRLLVRLGEVV